MEEQREEISRLQKIERQYMSLLKICLDQKQKKRTQGELIKIKKRLKCLHSTGSTDESTLSGNIEPESEADEHKNKYNILSQFPLQKISPHCNDTDINLLITILYIWKNEFLPALGEKNVKLDLSFLNERNSHYIMLDNLQKQSNLLSDIFNDYYKTKQTMLKTELKKKYQRIARHLPEGQLSEITRKILVSDI